MHAHTLNTHSNSPDQRPWPDQRATRPVKVDPGIVKRFLRHYSDRFVALNVAIQISERLHWVLCIIESQLLN